MASSVILKCEGVTYYEAFPRQAEFHRNKAKYRLFGGAAGPGKSLALLVEAIIQSHRHDKVDTLILRRTFPELETSIINRFRQLPSGLYASYNESKHLVTWLNGSTTRFGYSDSEKDIYQYQGGEFLFIGFDELTHFTHRQWQFLTSRNRCPVAGSRPCMAGASNPGNIGHEWVKSLFVEGHPCAGMDDVQIKNYNSADYAFIPAKVTDNPIYANDENYLNSLRALPKAMRAMFLEGDWSIAAGAYFDIWQEDAMTVSPNLINARDWWPRWISIDYGFDHHTAVYWWTASPPNSEGRRTIYTYRELVVRQTGPRELGKMIADRSKRRMPDGTIATERIESIYLSPDARAKRTDDDTIEVQLSDALRANGLPTCSIADNDRVGGWMLMYQLLQSGEWLISTDCGELIRALPVLTRDPDFTEDILKTDQLADDCGESARYGLKSQFKNHKNQPPMAERVQARVTSTDPTIIAIQSRKALQIETKRATPIPVVRRHRFQAGIQER